MASRMRPVASRKPCGGARKEGGRGRQGCGMKVCARAQGTWLLPPPSTTPPSLCPQAITPCAPRGAHLGPVQQLQVVAAGLIAEGLEPPHHLAFAAGPRLLLLGLHLLLAVEQALGQVGRGHGVGAIQQRKGLSAHALGAHARLLGLGGSLVLAPARGSAHAQDVPHVGHRGEAALREGAGACVVRSRGQRQ